MVAVSEKLSIAILQTSTVYLHAKRVGIGREEQSHQVKSLFVAVNEHGLRELMSMLLSHIKQRKTGLSNHVVPYVHLVTDILINV